MSFSSRYHLSNDFGLPTQLSGPVLAGSALRLVHGLAQDVRSAVLAACGLRQTEEGARQHRGRQQQQQLEAVASASYRMWCAVLLDALASPLNGVLLLTAAGPATAATAFLTEEEGSCSSLLTDALRSQAQTLLLNSFRSDPRAVPLAKAFAELEADLVGPSNSVAALLPLAYVRWQLR